MSWLHTQVRSSAQHHKQMSSIRIEGFHHLLVAECVHLNQDPTHAADPNPWRSCRTQNVCLFRASQLDLHLAHGSNMCSMAAVAAVDTKTVSRCCPVQALSTESRPSVSHQ